MERIFYDGTPGSVDRIMDVVGTTGVNNSPNRLYIRGDYLDRGGCIHVEDGYWWIDHNFSKVTPKKFEIKKKD